MKYSLFFIAFIMTLPIIGCNTFPIGFLSNEIGMDYSLPLQSTGAYDSGSVNYFEEPSLKLSASWKKMPNNPTEIVVQGRISQSLLLSVSFLYSNLTSYSWKGVVRTSDRETETRIDALYSDGNGDPFLQAIEKATIKRPSEPILDYTLDNSSPISRLPWTLAKATCNERKFRIMITIDKEKPEHNIFEYYWPAYIRMRSQKYQIVDDSDSVFAQLQGNEYLILKPIDEKLKYSLTTILGEIQATRELFLYLLSIDDNKE